MSEPMNQNDYDFDPQGRTENPWIKRTLGREMFYEGTQPRDKELGKKLDGPPRCFVMRRPTPANIYGGVEFWLQVGVRQDMTLIGAPFYSGIKIGQWTYKDDRGNVRIGVKYPPKNDALADFVRENYKLIVPKVYDGKTELWSDGTPKRNYDQIFAVEAYEVVFEYREIDVDDPKNPGRTKKKLVAVNDGAGKAKYKVDPRPWILKFRRPWYTMLKNRVLKPIVEEELASAEAPDPDGTVQKPKAKKWSGTLPTTDISRVMLKMYSRTGPEPAKGAMNVEYDLQFSEVTQIDSNAIVPVDELPSLPDGNIDWHKVYPPMTVDQAMDLVSKAQEVPAAEAEGHEDQGPPGTPPPDNGSDDDIPF